MNSSIRNYVWRCTRFKSRYYKLIYTSLGLFFIFHIFKFYFSCDDCEISLARNSLNNYGVDQTFWNRRSKNHTISKYSCNKLMEGDAKTLKDTIDKNEKYTIINSTTFINSVKDCPSFIEKRGYILKDDKILENPYSIAYSILFHKNIDAVERLLFRIYRPEHFICLHVDAKADQELRKAAILLAECFPNVFLTDSVSVVYAAFPRLQADINCMKDLLKLSNKWNYFINLVSEMFPIKTNSELVEILKVYNGANDIEGLDKRNHASRWNKKYIIKGEGKSARIAVQGDPKPPAPHNITIVKGSAFGIFSRAYVDFAMNDKRAVDLLEWSKDTYSPDEFFWSTLQHIKHNPHLKTPGGYLGVGEEKPWLAVYAAWGRASVDPCYSKKSVRGVCIFGVADLLQLTKRHELFANKFYLNFQPAALDCLEYWMQNKVDKTIDIDLDYYRKLPYVAKHI